MSKFALSGHTTPLLNGPAVPRVRSGRRLLAAIVTFWREFFQTTFTPYYPERHYMRGPGPACAAKRKAMKNRDFQ